MFSYTVPSIIKRLHVETVKEDEILLSFPEEETDEHLGPHGSAVCTYVQEGAVPVSGGTDGSSS
jgi:hypothetical protein